MNVGVTLTGNGKYIVQIRFPSIAMLVHNLQF